MNFVSSCGKGLVHISFADLYRGLQICKLDPVRITIFSKDEKADFRSIKPDFSPLSLKLY